MYDLPDFTLPAQADSSVYKNNIDESVTIHDAIAGAFYAYEAATPDMTVVINAGKIQNGITLTDIAAQTTAAFTAPTTDPRIDRIVIDSVTGVYSVIAGTEAASPVAPALTVGKIAIAQVLLQTSTVVIANSMITDERASKAGSAIGRGALVYSSVTLPVTNSLILPFDSETYDTDGIHDNAVNNTRLTVPAGVTKIKISCFVTWTSASAIAGPLLVDMYKNGSGSIAGAPRTYLLANTAGAGSVYMQSHSAMLEVVAGDYFELNAIESVTPAVSIIGGNPYNTWFSMEIVS